MDENEKKKRWRPSLTAYRELERKLAEQIEGTSKLVADCDHWRELYRGLLKDQKKMRKELDAHEVVSVSEYNALVKKYDDVVEESVSMSAELTQLRSDNAELVAKLSAQSNDSNAEISTLSGRINDLEHELTQKEVAIRMSEGRLEQMTRLVSDCKNEVEALRNRGFWARVFNR